MHGDTSSSDCSAYSGPGLIEQEISFEFHECLATFPTILRRKADGNIMALATSFRQKPIRQEIENHKIELGVTAQVWLIDGDSGKPMCQPVDVPQSSIFGGVYAYLDETDDGLVVTSTTENRLGTKIFTHIMKYTTKADGRRLADPIVLSDITPGLVSNDASDGDSIVSLSPDSTGAIWFVTAQGNIGISGPFDDDIDPPLTWNSIAATETVNNSFSTIKHPWLGDIAALTTNKALYIFRKDPKTGEPVQLHRKPYAIGNGPDTKPGQLHYPASIHLSDDEQQLYGTGSTPSFFGPEHGAEWVTITDNAKDALNLLVFDVATGDLIAASALFQDDDPRAPQARATENSCIAYGNTVIVPSTSGYPYPVKPVFDHEEAPFVGGLTRVDIIADANGVYFAQPVWTQYHRCAAEPRWCVNDGLIYTITRHSGAVDPTNVAEPDDTFSYTVLAFDTGELACPDIPLKMKAGAPEDPPTGADLHAMGNPLQMTCCMTTDTSGAPVMWQGTMSGYYRISGPAA